MNLNEKIINECEIIERDTSKLPKGVTARVRRTICWLDKKNANKRKYSKGVWEHVFNDPEYQRKLANRQILGEMEHPENSALKLDKDRTSHIVSSIYYGEPALIEGKMYTPVKTEFDLLPTEAGKFILILLEAGVKVGASTRADGELEEAVDEDGSKFMNVVESSYSFTTIDHTGDASCQNTEPDLIIKAAMSGYESKNLNKNVTMALLEKAGTAEAKKLEEQVRVDKQHKDCKCKLGEKKCSGGCSHSQDKEVELKEALKDDILKIEKDTEKIKKITKEIKDGEVDESVNENIYKDIEITVKDLIKGGKNDDEITAQIKADYKDANAAAFDLLPKVIQRIRNESKIKEELTTSSDLSGQPANLAAAKQDQEDSEKRGENIDHGLDGLDNKPFESKVNESDISTISDNDLVLRYKELAKDTNHQEVNKEVEAIMSEINKRKLGDKIKESTVNEVIVDAIGSKIKAFLNDNWSLFLTDDDLLPNGDPKSRKLDAIKNVVKVFKILPEKAKQYVDELGNTHLSAVPAMSNEKVEPSDSHNLGESTRLAVVIAEKNILAEQLKVIRDNYSNDVIRYANEIDALKEDKKVVVEHYSNDSIHFANEASALNEKITGLTKDLRANIEMKNENAIISKKNVETIKKISEEKTKIVGELNEKIAKLNKEVSTKEKTIKESENKYMLLQENKAKEIKALKETHSKEKINLYVDYRLKSIGLKLHENVLTLLRQSNDTDQVDTLIRETQDAIREGLTQSVNKISEVVIANPVDKVQADINSKVAIALKSFTGL